MKRCSQCKEWKEFGEFYKRSDRPIGLQSRCKKCANKGMAEYRKTETGKKVIHRINTSPKHQESMRRYDASEKGRKKQARFRQTEKSKAGHRKDSDKYRNNNPEKVKAQSAVLSAVRCGKLPHPSTLKCSECPNKAKHYHHHKGYSKEHWLDVVPICPTCHPKTEKGNQK